MASEDTVAELRALIEDMQKKHKAELDNVKGLLESNSVAKALETLTAANSNSEPEPADSSPKRRKVNKASTFFGAKVAQGQPRRSVTVRVPATTANLGPGFDTVGMALDVWNELTVERSDKFEMIVEGEGADIVPNSEDNLICEGVRTAFDYVGMKTPVLKYMCKNKIPFGRGLGSSSGAIVSGLIAGLALAGHELAIWGERGKGLYSGGTKMEPEELLQLASNMEGHPDNVCPCIYGGIHLAIKVDQGNQEAPHWRSSRVVDNHGMLMVAFVPNATGETKTLREVLPDTYTKEEAVFNIGRTAFLVNALAKGNLCELTFGVEDVMHQPQRGKAVYHHLEPLIKAANASGAHGCYLSGAGPTVMAICSGSSGDMFTQAHAERAESKIADAMIKAAAEAGWPGRCFITKPTMHGAYITAADPPYSEGVLEYLGGNRDSPL